jgi:hypothetical protein
VRKRGDLGGLFGKECVKKGLFLAKKAGENAHFCVSEVKSGVAGGISGQKRTLCPKTSKPGITPWKN